MLLVARYLLIFLLGSLIALLATHRLQSKKNDGVIQLKKRSIMMRYLIAVLLLCALLLILIIFVVALGGDNISSEEKYVPPLWYSTL